MRVLGIGDRFMEHMSSRDEQLVAAGIGVESVVLAVEQGLSSASAPAS